LKSGRESLDGFTDGVKFGGANQGISEIYLSVQNMDINLNAIQYGMKGSILKPPYFDQLCNA
jgi:hypothetical protein